MAPGYCGSCATVLAAAGLAGSCCGSCHDDDDSGYADLSELYELRDPGGKYVRVCCATQRLLADAGAAVPWEKLTPIF